MKVRSYENKMKVRSYENFWASQGALVVKNAPANAPSIPGSGRSPEGGNDISFPYYCLENPKDRGAWQAIVYRVT